MSSSILQACDFCGLEGGDDRRTLQVKERDPLTSVRGCGSHRAKRDVGARPNVRGRDIR
jgi:hypothetical protein